MSEQDSQVAIDSVFPPSAREAARKRCDNRFKEDHATYNILCWLKQALDELDLRDKEREEQSRRTAELEGENAELRRSVSEKTWQALDYENKVAFVRRHIEEMEAYCHDIEANGGIPVAVQENAALNENNRALQRRVETLETENAALQRRLDGRRATCLELAEAMFTAWAHNPPTAGAMTQWFREKLMDWWNPTLETARAAIAKLDDDNAELRNTILGYKEEIREAEQALAAAIGMIPEKCGHYQVGPHTAVSLARDAAAMITALRKAVAERYEVDNWLADHPDMMIHERKGQFVVVFRPNEFQSVILGSGPTPSAAIQDAMGKAKGGGE